MIFFNFIICLYFTAIFAVTTCELISRNSGRIWGGQAADISEVPYQVSIRKEGLLNEWAHYCGGSIISEKFVVSAAHCVEWVEKRRLKIVVGISNVNDPGTQYVVKDYQYHEKYDDRRIINDISVLEVDGVIKFSDNVKPIKLPKSGLVVPDDAPVLVSGYGQTENGYPIQLQKVFLKRVNQTKCEKLWFPHIIISKDMICANDIGKAAGFGDSGGPMVFGEGSDAVLIGAVSFGRRAGPHPLFPTVFANIIQQKEWILNKTKIQV